MHVRRQLVLILLVFLWALSTVSVTYGQNKHVAEPYAGFSGAVALANPAFVLPGIMVGVTYEYELIRGHWFGARIGVGAIQPSPETGAVLNYAAALVWDFAVTDSVMLNVNVGMLPGIGVTLMKSHHFQLEILPIIFLSGGSVLFNLSYGYKFRF